MCNKVFIPHYLPIKISVSQDPQYWLQLCYSTTEWQWGKFVRVVSCSAYGDLSHQLSITYMNASLMDQSLISHYCFPNSKTNLNVSQPASLNQAGCVSKLTVSNRAHWIGPNSFNNVLQNSIDKVDLTYVIVDVSCLLLVMDSFPSLQVWQIYATATCNIWDTLWKLFFCRIFEGEAFCKSDKVELGSYERGSLWHIDDRCQRLIRLKTPKKSGEHNWSHLYAWQAAHIPIGEVFECSHVIIDCFEEVANV